MYFFLFLVMQSVKSDDIGFKMRLGFDHSSSEIVNGLSSTCAIYELNSKTTFRIGNFKVRTQIKKDHN